MEKLIAILQDEIRLLERWAAQSEQGGWSTHQVQAQRERAAELKAVLYDIQNK